MTGGVFISPDIDPVKTREPPAVPQLRTGRPRFAPTEFQRQTARILRGCGCALPIVASNIGVTEKTLRKHFARELAEAHAELVAAIGLRVVSAALAGNIFAARYWLSCRGGPEWRVVESRLLGGDGSGMPIAVNSTSRVVVYIPDNGRDAGGSTPTLPETPAC